MFRYTQRSICGTKDRGHMDIKVGDIVVSKYAAPWTGKVIELNGNGGMAIVSVELDKRGNPLRKKIIKRLHCSWLIVKRCNND